jgi:hypothetical protein
VAHEALQRRRAAIFAAFCGLFLKMLSIFKLYNFFYEK